MEGLDDLVALASVDRGGDGFADEDEEDEQEVDDAAADEEVDTDKADIGVVEDDVWLLLTSIFCLFFFLQYFNYSIL